MSNVSVYTFRTFPHIYQLEEQLGQRPFVFGKLKQDIEEFKRIIATDKPELIIGIAKSPYKYSLIETEAINVYNRNKSVIKDGPPKYPLFIPSEIPPEFKIREKSTDSFCNWTMYQTAHFIAEEKLNTKLMFFHITRDDVGEINAILKEPPEYSPLAK